MKIDVLCYYVLVTFMISVLKSFTYGYKLIRNDIKFNSYPVKRKAPNTEQPYYIAPREERSDTNSLDALEINSDQHHHPVQNSGYQYQNLQGNNNQYSDIQRQQEFKNSFDLEERNSMLSKRSIKHEDIYGIVYGNGRPVGILEPYPRAFQFAPLRNQRETQKSSVILRQPTSNTIYTVSKLSSSPLTNSELERNENDETDLRRYTNEKYPSVLNDFKINSRLNTVNAYKRDNIELHSLSSRKLPDKEGRVIKRDATMKSTLPSIGTKDDTLKINDDKISELKAALSEIQNPEPSNKLENIEENLKAILSDMGLVEDNDEEAKESMVKEKRDTEKEDENLEEGANKIELVKVTHNEEKDSEEKRENKDHSVTDKSKLKKIADSQGTKVEEENDEIRIGGNDFNLNLKNLKSPYNSNPRPMNGEKPINKRSTSQIDVANYQEEGETFIRNKRQEEKAKNVDLMKGLEKSGDLTVSCNKSPLASSENKRETEEGNKNQVTTSVSTSDKAKREENEMQLKYNIQARIDAIKEQVKREIATLKSKSKRQKRNTPNTLLEEEEVSALNPEDHPEEKLIPHIRRRRNLNKNSEQELPSSKDGRDSKLDNYKDFNVVDKQSKIRNQENSEWQEGRIVKMQNENGLRDISITTDSSNIKLHKENLSGNKFETLQKYNREVQPNQSENSNKDKEKKRSVNDENKSQTVKIQEGTIKEVNADENNLQESNVENVNLLGQSLSKLNNFVIDTNGVGIQEIKDDNSLITKLCRVKKSPKYARQKRENALSQISMAFVPYRSRREDVEEDGSEFNDYRFYDNIANFQKRDSDGTDHSEYEDQKQSFSQSDMSSKDGNSSNFDRGKRHDFRGIMSLHSGGPMLQHLAAIRNRNVRLEDNTNNKQNKDAKFINQDEPQNIADLSDTDLFGSLSQSYEGELSRFKRIKRD